MQLRRHICTASITSYYNVQTKYNVCGKAEFQPWDFHAYTFWQENTWSSFKSFMTAVLWSMTVYFCKQVTHFLEVKHLTGKISRRVKTAFVSLQGSRYLPHHIFPCILKPDKELWTICGLGAKQKSHVYSDLYNFSHFITLTVPFRISPLVLQPSVHMAVYLWPTVQTTFLLISLLYLQ